MKNLGFTVNELLDACKEQVKKGNGDKHVIISSDDEGNSYHTLLYLFADNEDYIRFCLNVEQRDKHTVDNCVALG